MIKFRNKNKKSINDKIHELSVNQLKMEKDIDNLKNNYDNNYFDTIFSVADNIDEIDIDDIFNMQ